MSIPIHKGPWDTAPRCQGRTKKMSCINKRKYQSSIIRLQMSLLGAVRLREPHDSSAPRIVRKNFLQRTLENILSAGKGNYDGVFRRSINVECSKPSLHFFSMTQSTYSRELEGRCQYRCWHSAAGNSWVPRTHLCRKGCHLHDNSPQIRPGRFSRTSMTSTES